MLPIVIHNYYTTSVIEGAIEIEDCSIVGLVVSAIGVAGPIISVGDVVFTGAPWEGTRERFGGEEAGLIG